MKRENPFTRKTAINLFNHIAFILLFVFQVLFLKYTLFISLSFVSDFGT